MASVKGQQQAPAGIVPVAQSQRPVYSEPTQENFDWTVPVAERPQGTEDWIWSRSRWAKENWDKEQDSKKDAAYKKYTIDLADWQAQQEAEQQKLTNYNNQLTAMGQTPMTSLNDLPAVQIRRLGQAWQSTTDPALRDQYHQQALQLAQNAGLIPQGYAGSVNGLPTLGLAGTPSYAATQQDIVNRQNQQKIEQDQQQIDYATSKPYYKTSSGSGSKKTTTQDADDAYKDDANGIINELTDASLTPAQQKAKAANLRTKIKAMVANGIMTQAEGAQREAVINSIVKPTAKKTSNSAISPYSFLNVTLGK